MNQPFDEMLGMSALFQQLQTTSPLDPEPAFEEGGFSTMSASSTVPRIGQLQEALNNRSVMLEEALSLAGRMEEDRQRQATVIALQAAQLSAMQVQIDNQNYHQGVAPSSGVHPFHLLDSSQQAPLVMGLHSGSLPQRGYSTGAVPQGVPQIQHRGRQHPSHMVVPKYELYHQLSSSSSPGALVMSDLGAAPVYGTPMGMPLGASSSGSGVFHVHHPHGPQMLPQSQLPLNPSPGQIPNNRASQLRHTRSAQLLHSQHPLPPGLSPSQAKLASSMSLNMGSSPVFQPLHVLQQQQQQQFAAKLRRPAHTLVNPPVWAGSNWHPLNSVLSSGSSTGTGVFLPHLMNNDPIPMDAAATAAASVAAALSNHGNMGSTHSSANHNSANHSPILDSSLGGRQMTPGIRAAMHESLSSHASTSPPNALLRLSVGDAPGANLSSSPQPALTPSNSSELGIPPSRQLGIAPSCLAPLVPNTGTQMVAPYACSASRIGPHTGGNWSLPPSVFSNKASNLNLLAGEDGPNSPTAGSLSGDNGGPSSRETPPGLSLQGSGSVPKEVSPGTSGFLSPGVISSSGAGIALTLSEELAVEERRSSAGSIVPAGGLREAHSGSSVSAHMSHLRDLYGGSSAMGASGQLCEVLATHIAGGAGPTQFRDARMVSDLLGDGVSGSMHNMLLNKSLSGSASGPLLHGGGMARPRAMSGSADGTGSSDATGGVGPDSLMRDFKRATSALSASSYIAPPSGLSANGNGSFSGPVRSRERLVSSMLIGNNPPGGVIPAEVRHLQALQQSASAQSQHLQQQQQQQLAMGAGFGSVPEWMGVKQGDGLPSSMMVSQSGASSNAYGGSGSGIPHPMSQMLPNFQNHRPNMHHLLQQQQRQYEVKQLQMQQQYEIKQLQLQQRYEQLQYDEQQLAYEVQLQQQLQQLQRGNYEGELQTFGGPTTSEAGMSSIEIAQAARLEREINAMLELNSSTNH